MTTEVRVPTLGESVTEATVATWFKKPGDAVAADEMLCELETDKVTVEVPAPAAGVLGEIVANEGDTVGVDALLAMINEAGAAAAAPAPAAAAPAAAPGGWRNRRDGSDAWRIRHGGDRFHLVQKGRRLCRAGRNAVRVGNR